MTCLQLGNQRWRFLSVVLWICHMAVLVYSTSIVVDGDLILGGLFPVHEKGDKTPCSDKIYNRGLQRVEAMLYAVDMINNDSSILNGITLGVNIIDSCSKDTYALNQSLEFIRVSLDAMDTSGLECEDRSSPKVKYHSKPVRGIIGGSYSSVSLQVANLFRLFRIPQISPASTAKALSDKDRYEFFARTVPPDTFQAIAIMDLLEAFNWTYISVIYSEGSYGESGSDVLKSLAEARNICIAVSEKIPTDAHDNPIVFDNVLKALMKKPSARTVVMFARFDDARNILLSASRLNLSSQFQWVASDSWGKQQKLVEGLQEVAEGAITVELTSKNELMESNIFLSEVRVAINLSFYLMARSPRSIQECFVWDTIQMVPPRRNIRLGTHSTFQVMHGFDEYMGSLTPSNNGRNPWFKEYWQTFYGCKMQHDLHADLACPLNASVTDQPAYHQDSKVQFVVDAVYAYAYALAHLQRDICPYSPRVCPLMDSYDGGAFYKNYLLNVSFTNIVGSQVKFDQRGDGPARYSIYNFRKIKGTNNYNYSVVGTWYRELNLNLSELIYVGNSRHMPSSVCSLPCRVGEAMIMQQGDNCCWLCSACKPWEYMLDEFTCRDCGDGFWPYDHKLSCYELPHKYMRWSSYFAVIPMAISCLGICLTMGVIIVFLKHDDTPVVKASGRELSYMLLCGILICYLNTFLLLAKPSSIVCALQRFGIGFGFCLLYGALLTKTNRISRIFDSASRSARRPGFISPKSQVLITCCLVSIQIIATLVWMLLERPGIRFDYPTRDQVILKCRIKDSSFMVSLVYNMFLITTCTVYAVKTRKIPENFNESKFIGFTMYTTCIIWLAFVPIYFGTGNSFEVQITTLCISISLSASVALVCLYSPKVYIILWQPDKNVRKLTMNSATYKKNAPSSAVSANHGQSLVPKSSNEAQKAIHDKRR